MARILGVAGLRPDEAKEFAKQKNIELTALIYIDREDFTDFEIQHDTGF
jgi:hypothetical protein